MGERYVRAADAEWLAKFYFGRQALMARRLVERGVRLDMRLTNVHGRVIKEIVHVQ